MYINLNKKYILVNNEASRYCIPLKNFIYCQYNRVSLRTFLKFLDSITGQLLFVFIHLFIYLLIDWLIDFSGRVNRLLLRTVNNNLLWFKTFKSLLIYRRIPLEVFFWNRVFCGYCLNFQGCVFVLRWNFNKVSKQFFWDCASACFFFQVDLFHVFRANILFDIIWAWSYYTEEASVKKDKYF